MRGVVMTSAIGVDALLDAIPETLLVDVVGSTATDVVDLTHDSREVAERVAFACVVGERVDGHDFAERALEAGANVLLVERRLPLDVTQIVVTDVRRAMGPAAAAVHGYPSKQLAIVGITGTNGKTTTAHMLGTILAATGRSQRTMGTLSGTRTTPEAPDLQRQLAQFVRDGVDSVVMEVSSHAMVYHRVAGTEFDVVVFTNLGRDHLDLHESMEAYFRAKASLFEPSLAALGAANVDDLHGQLIVDAAAIEVTGFRRADAIDIEVGVAEHSFTWRGAAGPCAHRRRVQRHELARGADRGDAARRRTGGCGRGAGRAGAGARQVRDGQRRPPSSRRPRRRLRATRRTDSKRCCVRRGVWSLTAR